jgi:hypothetical protein
MTVNQQPQKLETTEASLLLIRRTREAARLRHWLLLVAVGISSIGVA